MNAYVYAKIQKKRWRPKTVTTTITTSDYDAKKVAISTRLVKGPSTFKRQEGVAADVAVGVQLKS